MKEWSDDVDQELEGRSSEVEKRYQPDQASDTGWGSAARKKAVDAAVSREHGETDISSAPDNNDLKTQTDHPSQDSAVRRYTGDAYEDLSSALWRGKITEVANVAEFSHDLSTELEQLPDHEGTVWRGSRPMRPASDYHLERYKPGDVVVENGYTSASTDRNEAYGGQVLWIIESKRGKSIEGLSEKLSEKEVLFDRFSRFLVTAKDYDATEDKYTIYMKQQ